MRPATEPRATHPPAPRRRAAALCYEAGRDRAPRVVASGQGHIAYRILALAHDHGGPCSTIPRWLRR